MSDEETPLIMLPVKTSSSNTSFSANEEYEGEEEEEVDHHNTHELNDIHTSDYTTSSTNMVVSFEAQQQRNNANNDRKKKAEAKSRRLSILNIKNSRTGRPFEKWYRGIAIRQLAHSELAAKFSRMNMYMNTLSVALTALTSSAIFTSISPPALEYYGDYNTTSASATASATDSTIGYLNLALLAGVISAFNTVLQGVMTTLAYGTKGEQHLAAFKAYTRMRFQLEDMIGENGEFNHCLESNEQEEAKKWVEKFLEVQESSPIVPQDVFDHHLERLFGSTK